MLINLRNALMAGKRLPYDAEVEYLESTGEQYIDTGVAPSTNGIFGMDMTFQALEYNDGCCGGTFGPGGAGNCYLNLYNNKLYIRKEGYTSTGTEGQSWNDAGFYNLSGWNRVILTNSASINGNLVRSGIVNTTKRNTFTFALFAYNRAGTIRGFIKVRISKCELSLDNVLIRDFIPVRKGNVGYLYDRVTGKLFGNAGTGDFVLGPDVVPVEYIESHGTEYIDTGAIPDDSTGIEVVHTICPDNEKDNIIFGARQDSGNTRYWSDIDWGPNDNVGWGFNTYSGSSERFALASSDVGRVITNSLNYMNDRAGKIDGVTYDSSLQSKTLATINRSIYLFGANNMGTIAVRGTFKVYSAKISKGQTLVNKFLPVRVGTGSTWEGAMMDTLTRRIYRNAGTGAFTYGNDLKYPIPAE